MKHSKFPMTAEPQQKTVCIALWFLQAKQEFSSLGGWGTTGTKASVTCFCLIPNIKINNDFVIVHAFKWNKKAVNI